MRPVFRNVGAALATTIRSKKIAAKAAHTFLILIILSSFSNTLLAQFSRLPSTGQPGDAMIHAWLSQESEKLFDSFLEGIESKEDWLAQRPRLKEEYLYMIGLSPMPEKTPLQATITGTLKGDGFEVDMIHYQSSPGLYVTGNLYRPSNYRRGEKLPTILYVCGHAQQGRNGNKTAYQSHGAWFARHGYICLMIDTVQRAEVKGIHHGTYSHNRWWWHSRGYTPAGVETWNGIRGLDYLLSRPDVDPDRIGLTGISGGGSVSFWIAAADERVKVVVPVSGMADLPGYIPNKIVDEHCDCMFLYNTYQWSWHNISAMVAPRPLLFVNSDQDFIFPMPANERVINKLETVYSLFGAGHHVDSLVSMGGHAYREDIRRASFRFMNIYLKNDPSPVLDSEVDLVTGRRGEEVHPIAPEKLRVFPTDLDLPTDSINDVIDQHFVPMAKVAVPKAENFKDWKQDLISELRSITFRSFPSRIPAARVVEKKESHEWKVETEQGIIVSLKQLEHSEDPEEVVLHINHGRSQQTVPSGHEHNSRIIYRLDPRGVGDTQWTIRNPPNFVARSFPLIGRTVDDGRIWDIIAAARLLKEKYGDEIPLVLSGKGASAVLASYAALLEPDIDRLSLDQPSASHNKSDCPPLLNVLRICDVPDVIGALAPTPIRLLDFDEQAALKVAAIYQAAGASDQLKSSGGF